MTLVQPFALCFNPGIERGREIETGPALTAAIRTALEESHHIVHEFATFREGDIGGLATGTSAYINHNMNVPDRE